MKLIPEWQKPRAILLAYPESVKDPHKSKNDDYSEQKNFLMILLKESLRIYL